jgi:hypothetical protein
MIKPTTWIGLIWIHVEWMRCRKHSTACPNPRIRCGTQIAERCKLQGLKKGIEIGGSLRCRLWKTECNEHCSTPCAREPQHSLWICRRWHQHTLKKSAVHSLNLLVKSFLINNAAFKIFRLLVYNFEFFIWFFEESMNEQTVTHSAKSKIWDKFLSRKGKQMECLVCLLPKRWTFWSNRFTLDYEEDSVPAVNILQSLSVAEAFSSSSRGEPRKEPWSPYLGGTGLVYRKVGHQYNSDLEKGVYITQVPCRQLMLLKAQLIGIHLWKRRTIYYAHSRKHLPLLRRRSVHENNTWRPSALLPEKQNRL